MIPFLDLTSIRHNSQNSLHWKFVNAIGDTAARLYDLPAGRDGHIRWSRKGHG